MNQQQNTLKSADKLFTILEQLEEEGRKTVTELSNELEMPKSTVQVYLNTLHSNKFVRKTDSGYEIGLRFLEYGVTSLWSEPVYPQVKSKVEELADTTGELAACFVEEHDEAVYIYGIEGERAIRTNLSIGDRSPLHSTASGKAIMAHLGEDIVMKIIEEQGLTQQTANTITDRDNLLDELEEIRERGYAYSKGESIDRKRSVAAPIIVDGEIAGSISVAGPASRFVGDYFEEELPHAVQEVTNELELRLTYSQTGI